MSVNVPKNNVVAAEIVMKPTGYTRADFDHSPLIVLYEITRACDLMCVHCRADAQRRCGPGELATDQAKLMFQQLTEFPRQPLLVLTGGDPLKRPDVFELVSHARSLGLDVAMTPSATPLVTADAIRNLHESGLHRLAVSLDGADAATHDGFRRVRGSFVRTFEIIRDARAIGLPVQVNTTIARHNVHQVDAIAEMLAGLDIVLWSVFFLVPTGRAMAGQRITADQYEGVFERLWHHTRTQPYAIKTTEAPHYRRFLLRKLKGSGRPVRLDGPHIGTNDGRGVLFVSHTGELFPSGFLPILCGKFPHDSLIHVYQDSVVFRALRDADALEGKCGECEFRHVCGGSRARAFALTGDPLAPEPDCLYIPSHNAGEDAMEPIPTGARY